jgi:hypothetical protein
VSGGEYTHLDPSLKEYLSWPDRDQAELLISLTERGNWGRYFAYSRNNLKTSKNNEHSDELCSRERAGADAERPSRSLLPSESGIPAH